MAEQLTSFEREVPYTQADFNRTRSILYDCAGITLADHKQDMAYNRLVRRLRALKLPTFHAYFSYLERHEGEFSHFINAMTTNLTAFFREKHHFDFLAGQLIPSLAAQGRRSIRGWSAGCSVGEETYSIAIAMKGMTPVSMDDWSIELHATDIDSSVLDTARQGVYSLERVRALPAEVKRQWFLRGIGAQTGKAMVRPELRQLVRFHQLNLMERWDVPSALDFVFCRNVMIYFDNETQSRLLDRMAQVIRPGGYLFVGHSESPYRLTDRFELIGKTIYQRVK
ncbi:MAG: protein-glutamate O-methyltransferase CheR [Marinobacterium sp.]|nr:protein-glutamate O-methyltransferase CheR [Marinobacterium sp.]